MALATDSGVVGDRITKVGTVNVSGLEAGASWEYAVNGGSFVTGTGTSFTLTGDGDSIDKAAVDKKIKAAKQKLPKK